MSVAACPGCDVAAPAAQTTRAGTATHELFLPTIHCLACLSAVEKTLTALPGIRSARVNLSRKHVSITATPGQDPAPWIAALSAAGFEAHEARGQPKDTAEANLMLRLGIAGFAMMNVMLLSVAVWSGAADSTRDLFHWVAASIAMPAALYCAQPFFSNALSALRAGRLNMDVPISVAILLACGLSLYETFTGGAHTYFDAALSLTFFLLAGRFLEQRMRRAARSAASDLAALEPSRVTLVQGETRVSTPIDDIRAGQTLWLAAGSRVPVDATLAASSVTVDRSALTGESAPVTIVKGAVLIAGDIVLTGPVTATTTVDAAGSTLRRMVELAATAENARGKYTGLADLAARIYAPLVHGLAFVAAAGWYLATGNAHHALMVAISTLIITCPCALGLAVPAVATVATGRLFRRGVLVKSDTALERLAEVDTIIFDKTGTITSAALEPSTEIPQDLLPVLKALAGASDHPLSRSVAQHLHGVPTASLADLAEHRGKGIQGTFNGTRVRLGSGAWLGAEIATGFQVGTTTYPMIPAERILPGMPDLVGALRNDGFAVQLLSGDGEAPTQATADALGIETAHAAQSPEDKLHLVQTLQAEGRKVLMVGDGLNDTLALVEAHASMAPGHALEASQNAADLVLLDADPSHIRVALRIARSARRRILENFGVAAVYNMVAIPIAVAGFATPLLAALAMSTSSICVTLNALRSKA